MSAKGFFGAIKRAARNNISTLLTLALIIILVIFFFWPRIFITIKAGQGGVLYKRFSGGTVIETVYPEGFHIIWPWDTMTIYNLRVQTANHQFDVLTNEGLKVIIHLAVRYHPERDLLSVMHKYVGEDYLNTIVIPEIEMTVRSYVADGDVKNSYQTLTNKNTFQKVVNDAIERVSRKYINIDDVMVTRVTLPEYIEKAIMEKIEQQQLALAYQYRIKREEQEAERKRVEAEGTKRFNLIIDDSLTEKVLLWKGIQATKEIASSNNAKIVLIGSDKQSLPVILNAEQYKADKPEANENGQVSKEQKEAPPEEIAMTKGSEPAVSMEKLKKLFNAEDATEAKKP